MRKQNKVIEFGIIGTVSVNLLRFVKGGPIAMLPGGWISTVALLILGLIKFADKRNTGWLTSGFQHLFGGVVGKRLRALIVDLQNRDEAFRKIAPAFKTVLGKLEQGDLRAAALVADRIYKANKSGNKAVGDILDRQIEKSLTVFFKTFGYGLIRKWTRTAMVVKDGPLSGETILNELDVALKREARTLREYLKVAVLQVSPTAYARNRITRITDRKSFLELIQELKKEGHPPLVRVDYGMTQNRARTLEFASPVPHSALGRFFVKLRGFLRRKITWPLLKALLFLIKTTRMVWGKLKGLPGLIFGKIFNVLERITNRSCKAVGLQTSNSYGVCAMAYQRDLSILRALLDSFVGAKGKEYDHTRKMYLRESGVAVNYDAF